MFRFKLFIAIAVFAAWISIHAQPTHAADDVEVNLDVLDDIRDYRPPPMFDPKNAPLTSYNQNKKQVKEFPLEVKTRKNSMNPQFKPHVKVAPPAFVKPVEREPVYKLATPVPLTGYSSAPLPAPVPKRKPYLQKAAVSQTALKSLLPDVEPSAARMPPVPKRRPKKLHASKSFIQNTIAARKPITKETLIEPSVQDILASIESNKSVEAKPPPPAAEPPPVLQEQGSRQPDNKQPIGVEYSAKQIISLPFAPGATDMNVKTRQVFDKEAFDLLKKNPNFRVQVQAFATPFGEGQSSARRLSLTRAISIRAYLIEKNVDPKRIDVRALGTKTGTAPLDRVDLVFIDENDVL